MTARSARGISLVEVLVALALGLVLTLGMVTLHARVLQLSADSHRAADAQDTLRIALAVLEYDLAHAGYWGLVPRADHIAGRRTDAVPLAVTVIGDCGPAWTIDLERIVEAWTDGWPLACGPYGGVMPTGAGLVLRRVDTRAAAPDMGVLQVHADPWGGRLLADGAPADPGAEVHDLVARAYYVSPRSTGDANRPSLRRKTLQRGPRLVDEEIVAGVAAMEIAFGVDTDPPGAPGHGQPNHFVAPETATGPVVAVRIRLAADDPARFTVTRSIPLRNGAAP
jgi:type IV pilus assembly protein PilW